jgi:hypothetical protein
MVVGRDLSRANRGRRITNAARASRAHAGDRPHRPNSSEISRNWIESPARARRRAPLV